MKIESPDIVHKSDVDGVRLNIENAQAVRGAYKELLAAVQERRPNARVTGVTVERMHQRRHGRELLLGVVRDPVFGPIIAFGAGGTTVEVLRDRAVALPPINGFLAQRLIAQTRIAPLLGAFRQLPPVVLVLVPRGQAAGGGEIVLTQDDQLGELPNADILVEGDRIAAIGPNLDAEGATVIDATGDIVIPGFVDTHRHTWETSIRTSAPDYTLGAYFGAILDKFAPNYRPDDVYAGNLWGSLECINAGITSLVDWSHIMNTPDHADEAIRGLRDSGIRSVFAFGFPNTSIQAWWFGPDYGGSVERIDGADARRVRKEQLSDDGALITMALATRGTNFCKPDVVQFEWELAKELGINITVHVAMDRFGYTKMQLRALKDMGLLYPNTTYIHSSHLLDDEWQMVADSGGNVSLAPQIELQMGHGWAPAATATKMGIPVGLSSDVATTAE